MVMGSSCPLSHFLATDFPAIQDRAELMSEKPFWLGQVTGASMGHKSDLSMTPAPSHKMDTSQALGLTGLK